jgi:hypothetical protein
MHVPACVCVHVHAGGGLGWAWVNSCTCVACHYWCGGWNSRTELIHEHAHVPANACTTTNPSRQSCPSIVSFFLAALAFLESLQTSHNPLHAESSFLGHLCGILAGLLHVHVLCTLRPWSWLPLSLLRSGRRRRGSESRRDGSEGWGGQWGGRRQRFYGHGTWGEGDRAGTPHGRQYAGSQ